MRRLFECLKRRNMFRVAGIYLAASWLIIQVVNTLTLPLRLPDWVSALVFVLLALGFPVALTLAWVYELTTDGVVRAASVAPEKSLNPLAARRLDRVLVAVLVLLVLVLAGDRVFHGQRQG